MKAGDCMKLQYTVPGNDFTRAGEASGAVKTTLKRLGFPPECIRRVAIAMYEGEINMVIHAGGGEAEVEILPHQITVVLTDNGPGIPDVQKAMTEGFSTAPETVRNLGFGAGMGLPNIKKYTDELTIDTEPGKGTRVRMVVRIPAGVDSAQ